MIDQCDQMLKYIEPKFSRSCSKSSCKGYYLKVTLFKLALKVAIHFGFF